MHSTSTERKPIKSSKLKDALSSLDKISVNSVMHQFNIIKEESQLTQSLVYFNDSKPNQIGVDSILQISQQLATGKIVRAKFKVCDKWLKPNGVFTIVGIDKQKTQKNARILFYESNAWYIRKTLQAASIVHVSLISNPTKPE